MNMGAKSSFAKLENTSEANSSIKMLPVGSNLQKTKFDWDLKDFFDEARTKLKAFLEKYN